MLRRGAIPLLAEEGNNTMRRILFATVILLASYASPASAQSPQTDRTLLDTYCVTCHNQKTAVAGLMLDKVDAAKAGQDPAVWEKVVHKLRSRALPPPGRPRPDAPSYQALITHLESELDRAASARPNPGRPAIRRRNRTEYANAIRDLLGVDINAEALLPVDEVDQGFDNIGDALSVTPVLLERYLSAARVISRMAVGEPKARPFSEKYELSKFLTQDDRMGDDLPFGSRGGIAVRHSFPADGEYTIRVFLQRNSRDYIRGLAEPHPLDFRIDGERIKLLTVGGGDELKGEPGPIFSQAAKIGDPASETYEHGGVVERMEVRFRAEAGQRLVAVTFLSKGTIPEGAYQASLSQFQLVQYKGGNPYIDNVVITGPYNATGVAETPSRQQVFVCRPKRTPEEDACAEKTLSMLERRAYRRSPTDKNVRTLLRGCPDGRGEGGFGFGILVGFARILAGAWVLFFNLGSPTRVGGRSP